MNRVSVKWVNDGPIHELLDEQGTSLYRVYEKSSMEGLVALANFAKQEGYPSVSDQESEDLRPFAMLPNEIRGWIKVSWPAYFRHYDDLLPERPACYYIGRNSTDFIFKVEYKHNHRDFDRGDGYEVYRWKYGQHLMFQKCFHTATGSDVKRWMEQAIKEEGVRMYLSNVGTSK